MNKIIKLPSVLLCLTLISACSFDKQVVISPKEWQSAIIQVEHKYGQEVNKNLKPYFKKAQLPYPPKKISMLAFKKEKRLELWAKNAKQWKHIKNYPLTAYSGTLGPKLKRNDGQIPEGIYKVLGFNPYSSQHLSLLLNYPNQWDKKKAKEEGRTDLGDNIFIHGKEKSVGCLAVGDKAIDELFVLTHQVGKENTQIIIAPNDLRKRSAYLSNQNNPKWAASLYKKLKLTLQKFTT